MPRRIGRPTVRREPGERVPIATRLRGEIYNQLIDAAGANDRPVAAEIELRLEQSFRDDRIEKQLAEMLRLLKGGAASPDDWRKAMGIPVLQ